MAVMLYALKKVEPMQFFFVIQGFVLVLIILEVLNWPVIEIGTEAQTSDFINI